MNTKKYYDEVYYTRENRIVAMLGFSNKEVVKERQFIFKWVLKTNPKQILDLGCGKGHFTHYLFSKGYNVTGVDISTKIVNYAKKTYPRCRFLVHNVETTPLKHKYDFIYSMQVLEHIFDLNRFLTNISQALNPKGILILATPNILAPKIRLKVLFGIDSTFRDLAHLRFFSPSHLKEIVIKNGFKIEELTGTGRLSLLSVNLSGNVLLTVSKL